MDDTELEKRLYDFWNILNCCYSRDTAFPSLQQEWNTKNKTLGHCAIVALVFNDEFGGKIKRTVVGDISHYFNELNGNYYDFTREQFDLKGMDIDYENSIERNREYILSSEDTRRRYMLFSNRFYCATKGHTWSPIIEKQGSLGTCYFFRECLKCRETLQYTSATVLSNNNHIYLDEEWFIMSDSEKEEARKLSLRFNYFE